MLNKILGMLLLGIALISCGTSQKFHASVSEDKPLFAAINELHKHPENAKAQNDLKLLYGKSIARHEEAVTIFRNSNDPKRWDKLINELNALQNIYNSIESTPGGLSVIKPVNYLDELQSVKGQAAEDYYAKGILFLSKDGRENNLESYFAFKKANEYINGYKEVTKLMNESYEKSVVNVVINPIEESNAFFARFDQWNNDFQYRPEEYQQALVRDLGNKNSIGVPARFYTDRDATRNNIDADWAIDVSWRNIDPIQSMPYHYNRTVSQNIQIGSDTSGKAVYRTVYATVHIIQNTYRVRGDIDYRLIDLENHSNIDQGLLGDEVSWTVSYATYSGDSRALSHEDWYLINNRSSFRSNPTRGDILNNLMRKIYPDLRRRIQDALNS